MGGRDSRDGLHYAPKAQFIYEGKTIGLRPASVALLDKHLKAAYQNGQRVTGTECDGLLDCGCLERSRLRLDDLGSAPDRRKKERGPSVNK
ncbi:MAG: hypothetical protein EBR81_06275 [Proteobacteria bacterium]|nr:hypothetical protein [Pseudomonadota bacterium]